MRSLFASFILLLLLTACGFKNLIQNENLKDVDYVLMTDDAADTFIFNNELERIFGKNNKGSKFTLEINYAVDTNDYFARYDSITARKKVKIILKYKLINNHNSIVVLSGELVDFDTFSITAGKPYSDHRNESSVTNSLVISLINELKGIVALTLAK